MDTVTLLLLSASVICSTARAVFSKKLGVLNSSKHNFYITQTVLFGVAAVMIFILNIKSIGRPSITTMILAIAYSIFTVSSQWTYTIALTKAPVSVCAMVYSFGFIIPTVFGTVVWRESVNLLKKSGKSTGLTAFENILTRIGITALTSGHLPHSYQLFRDYTVKIIFPEVSFRNRRSDVYIQRLLRRFRSSET